MPHGRPLKAPDLDLDMDKVRQWFEENQTRCESPSHQLGDEPLAEEYYQTPHTVAFLCDDCNATAWGLEGRARKAWDIRLAEHMWDLMCRRSYVQTNIKSDFVLEEVVAQRAETVREIAKLKTTERAKDQREIRTHIRESQVKIGMADDEILSARNRQDMRVQAGTSRLGPARIDRGSVLRAKLIAPALPDKKEGE